MLEKVPHEAKKEIPIFPRAASKKQFGLLTRLKARINIVHVGNNLFLGYCPYHNIYYLDYKHTNEEIRCPNCDRKWVTTH